MGARRNYAIPKFLGKADMLSYFATDIAGNFGYTSLLKGIPLLNNVSQVVNLSKRIIPYEIFPKTVTTDKLMLKRMVSHSLMPEDKYV